MGDGETDQRLSRFIKFGSVIFDFSLILLSGKDSHPGAEHQRHDEHHDGHFDEGKTIFD